MIQFVLLPAILFGILLTLIFGLLAFNSDNKLFFESYKISLSFTLVGILGAAIKSAIDTSITQRQKRAEIFKEFTEIFSGFYGLRKLHEAAIRATNGVFGKDEYIGLMRDCVKTAVDLEGRYGALKIAIIHQYGLPEGDYSAKSLDEWISRWEGAKGQQRIRYALDLLGQLYDLWRYKFQDSKEGRQVRDPLPGQGPFSNGVGGI